MNRLHTLLLFSLFASAFLSQTGFAADTISSVVDAEVYAELSRSSDDRIYILVVLHPLATQNLTLEQRIAEVAVIQDPVLTAVQPPDFAVVYRYETFPCLTGWVNARGLQDLAAHPNVRRIGLDAEIQAFLDVSVPFINANQVHTAGYTGQGITVAVLDSGIDSAHSDLSDNIATGAYHFLGDGSNVGPGAVDDNGHGTHVAGIITSNGTSAPVGVAPDADILAIKVLDSAGYGNVSDWAAGVNYVVTNQGSYAHLCAINMSLGTYGYPECPCDNEDTYTELMQAAVQAAKASGVVSFAATGNRGFCNIMGSPACLSATTAVAAVYDNSYGAVDWYFYGGYICTDAFSLPDLITCFSQRSGCNELAAPGAFINSSQMGGGATVMSGTSMATPHVTGLAALMCEKAGDLGITLTPDDIVQIMKDTGQATSDPCDGSPNPQRIDALAAVNSVGADSACVGLVDFEDDPQVGANITCNPDSGPYECNPTHHAWLLSKGIDITGSPNGYLHSNQIGGSLGQTGVVIGYAAPNFGESHLGISDNEVLSIHFLGHPAQDVEVELTVAPIPGNDGVSSTIYLEAFDAANNFLDSATLSFTGVTGGNHTPATISISRTVPDVDRIDLSVIGSHAIGGIWLESVQCGSPLSRVPEIATALPFVLYPSSPNPFNPATEIRYDLLTPTQVRLRIFSSDGRLVRTLIDTPRQDPGSYLMRWQGRDDLGLRVASGVYLLQLEAGARTATQKVVMIK